MFLASNFLVPNSTFIVELVAFLLVLAALRRWVLPPVNRIMQERQDTIRKALEDAEEARRRSEQAEADYRKAIDEARTEARRLVDEANRVAEDMRTEARGRAEQEYQRIIDRASGDIAASVSRATEELRQQVGSLVVAAVERVVSESFDDERHRQLIDRTVADLEREAGLSGVSQ
ncbi:MAG TPA: F0F1 ATP synthase subunit B [Acidimicrobiales bacterium]|nr:F0F1 ATP synthase subunit B [Acidimicrobiales bacterium]